MNLALQLSEIEKQVSTLISENIDLKKKNAELEILVQKLKCCENCKHHGFMGNELICHLESYDTEFECMKTKSHWELVEE